MTEREFHAKEILDVACNGQKIALVKETGKIVNCMTLQCEKCGFAINGLPANCEETTREWCASEHIERPKLTKNEKMLLSLLDERWKYMARDQDENLFIFERRPSKDYDINIWNNTRSPYVSRVDVLIRDSFSMVKWEDENPWSIEDLKKLPVEE